MTERHSHQHGLSVVELMVALLLASFLTMGMVYIFTSNSDTFRLNEASARVQEAGRTASDILSRAVRNADYWGCASAFGGSDGVDSMVNEGGGFDSDFFLTGLSGESDVSADHPDFNNIVEKSDLVVFGGLETGASLSLDQRTPINSATINTGEDSDQYFDVGDLILINDCRSANLVQITNFNNDGIVANTGGSTTPGNSTQIQNDFQKGASVFQPTRNAFYVRRQVDPDTGEETRALVFTPGNNDTASGDVGTWGSPVELVSHIRDLRIQFGLDEDENGSVETWSSPGTGVDPEEAIAVRYSFLVRSPQDDVVEELQSYCFPGWADCENDSSKLEEADDHHLYRVYTSTASLRNRLGE